MNAQIDWIDWLNGISHTWSQTMLRASWQGGLALLLAGILCALLAHLGGSGRLQSWFWRLGYAKFLICLLGLTPIALPLLHPAPPEIQSAPALIAAPSLPPPPISDGPPIAIQTPSTPEIPSTPVAPIVIEAPHANLTAESWLFALWSVGVVVCGGRLIRTWRRTRALRSAATLNEPTTEIAAQLAQLMSVRPPQVLISNHLPSPILIGIRHPAILLPAHMLHDNQTRLRLILAHELAHLKRRDLAWNFLQTLVATLFFFHPLLWLTRRPWSLAAEIACDDLALKTTGASRADYGRTLLEFVQQHRDRSPALLGVGVAESAGNLRRRLIAMKTMTYPRKYTLAAAALTGFIALAAFIPWKLVAHEIPPQLSPNPVVTPVASPAAPTVQVADATPMAQSPGTKDMPSAGTPAAPTLPSTTGTPAPSIPSAPAPDPAQTPVPAVNSDIRLRDLIAARDSAKLQLENLKNRVGAQSPAVREAEAGIRTFDQAIAEETKLLQSAPLTFSGQIGATIADIRAPMDATVAVIPIKEGATVKKGDVLFKLESQEARTALDLARARLSVAQVQLDNLRARFNAGAGTTVDEVKIAELQIQTEKTLLESKMLDLESLTLTAPFDGILSTIDISPGQAITRGSVMTRLVNNTDLRADFLIPYSALSRISVGQKAVVLVGNDPAAEIPAEITFISPVADTRAGAILIRARITGKTNNLKPGMYADIRVDAKK